MDTKAHARAVFEQVEFNSRKLTSSEIDWLVDFKLTIDDLAQPDETLRKIACNFLIYAPILKWLREK